MIYCKGLWGLRPLSVGSAALVRVLSAVLIYVLKVIKKCRVTIIYVSVKIISCFVLIVEYLRCSLVVIAIVNGVKLLGILILVILVIHFLEFLSVNSRNLVVDLLNLIVQLVIYITHLYDNLF